MHRVSPFQRQSVFTDEQGESTSGFCFQISDEKILLCIAVEFSLEFYQTYCKEDDNFEIYLPFLHPLYFMREILVEKLFSVWGIPYSFLLFIVIIKMKN